MTDTCYILMNTGAKFCSDSLYSLGIIGKFCLIEMCQHEVIMFAHIVCVLCCNYSHGHANEYLYKGSLGSM